MHLFNSHPQTKARRERVIIRLEEQLKYERKTVNILEKGMAYEPLTDEDKKRINKELRILKERI